MLEVVAWMKLGSIDETTAHIIPLDVDRVVNVRDAIGKRIELLNVLEKVMRERGTMVPDPDWITPYIPKLKERGFRKDATE